MHTTYLDFFGRPAVKLVKKRCSEKCGEGLVYVRFSSSPSFPPFSPVHSRRKLTSTPLSSLPVPRSLIRPSFSHPSFNHLLPLSSIFPCSPFRSNTP
jgi:hypothetical protein